MCFRPSSQLKKNFHFCLKTDNEIEDSWQEFFNQAEAIKDFQAPYRKPGGELCWLLTQAIPLRDKSGNFRGFQGADKDISKLKSRENELKESIKTLEVENALTLFIINHNENLQVVWEAEKLQYSKKASELDCFVSTLN